jgi:hypothetical protein
MQALGIHTFNGSIHFSSLFLFFFRPSGTWVRMLCTNINIWIRFIIFVGHPTILSFRTLYDYCILPFSGTMLQIFLHQVAVLGLQRT